MSTFISKYKILQKIGEGSFSEVLKCEDRATKELLAAKILKRNFENTNDVLYCAEIIAMQKLSRHPNVLYMHEYFFERTTFKLVFIFELMDMSLYEFMKSKKRCIPENKVKNYLYQMLKGLEYLHRHGLFHRDIKPENVLVRVLPKQEELIKIADLGSIRGIYSKQPYTEYISTRWYRSPECLLTIGHYGPKMDIWATGCVFYEILTTKPLFPGTNEIDQLAKIHSILGTPTMRILNKLKSRSKNFKNFNRQIGTGLAPLINQFSEDAQTILKLMLQYDPDIRSNARRVLQHKYFANLRDEERIMKYSKAMIHQDGGDMAISPFAVNVTNRNKQFNKFHSNSLKSFFNPEVNKQALESATTIELLNQTAIELSANIHRKNKSLNPGFKCLMKNFQSATKKVNYRHMKKDAFRNTTSNLINQVISYDKPAQKQFHSSSNIMTKRNSSTEKAKLPEAKRLKF